MPPRINLFASSRTLAFRARTPATTSSPISRFAVSRSYASDQSNKLPEADNQQQEVGPNMQQQEHVSEEAAKMAQMTGSEGPDLSQGTPVQDILAEDKEAQKNAPQVLKDSLRTGQSPPKPGTRPFSTLARRLQQQDTISSNTPAHDDAVFGLSVPSSSTEIDSPGHKFPLPTLPIPSTMHKDYRYEPIVDQVTNLMMKDGKLSVAQRNMSYILTHLRTASPPTYNPNRPLLPGAPPASHLPLNPVLYLTVALDSIAPLLRIRSQRGAAGGGMALQIPVPLGLRQRRRQAFTWVLDAASKRKSRGSGRGMLAQRIAEELVSIVEGKSSIWEKRTGVHKIATTARSNLGFGARRGRK